MRTLTRARSMRTALHESTGSKPLVLTAALLMICAQLIFRAWALYPSYFYLDDYALLLDAKGQRLDASYALEPWNSHLMPGGRIVAWIVVHGGVLNWGLAATLTLLTQLLASLAALWMLRTLFGDRWAILAPLGIYLYSALTMAALMWWTACLNQLAMQLGFFVAVGAWVRYLRGDRLRWALVAYCGIAGGLLFDVKALLVAPVLIALAFGWFAEGSPWRRVRGLLRRYWRAALIATPPLMAYVVFYSTQVNQPFERATPDLAVELTGSMIGKAFLTAAFGGPWRWQPLAPPNAFADPPAWAVTACCVAFALVVLYGMLRRRGTLRAWVLLLGYLLVLMALVLTSRGPVYGPLIGLEYRYLTDAACVLALCLGLAFLPIQGAVQSSRPRDPPLLLWRVPPWVVAALVTVVCLSGLLSSSRQVGFWHRDNASEPYMRTLAADLAAYGAVDLFDAPAPDSVYPAIFAPDNSVRRLASLISDRVSFPEVSPQLAVVGNDGGLRRAAIQPGVVSSPGPVPDCGWKVDSSGATIPLTGAAFDWIWWLRIGYLSSQDSPVTVSAGDTQVTTTVQRGPNSLYVRVSGTFDDVHLDGLDPGSSVCVDTIEVGQPIPGATLDDDAQCGDRRAARGGERRVPRSRHVASRRRPGGANDPHLVSVR